MLNSYSTISPSNDVIPFLVGRNVVLSVDSEANRRDRDSSRASSKQLCEYKWADKSNYTGKILSVRDRMVAYRLYHQNTGEAVRVLDRETRSRHLIKDFRARTVDLQWAVHQNLLAVVDCDASLHIYAVDKNGDTWYVVHRTNMEDVDISKNIVVNMHGFQREVSQCHERQES